MELIRIFFALLIAVLCPMSARAQWTNSVDHDPIDDTKTAYAISAGYVSTRPMSPPYTGTKMSVGYGCSIRSEWAYFWFDNKPNITNDDTKNGYRLSKSRIRWDDIATSIELIQERGDNSLHFVDAASGIGKLIRHNELLVEVKWYGQGDVYFQVPLAGSSAAIKTARQACGIGPELARRARETESRASEDTVAEESPEAPALDSESEPPPIRPFGGAAPGEAEETRPAETGEGLDESTTAPFEIEGLDRDPHYAPVPEYRIQVNATIRVRITVDPQGRVVQRFLLLKGAADLEKATMDALARWRFNPLPPNAPQERQEGIVTFRF